MKPLSLVKGGKASATVILPDGANALTEQAAEFLTEYVQRMTGAKLPVARESRAKSGSGARIFLGTTQAARAAGIEISTLRDDGFALQAAGQDLFVAGRDILFPTERDVNGFTACRGTLTGVFRLLEDCGGVRWLIPTPKGEVVPESADFRVPGDLRLREEPTFSYVSISGVNRFGRRVWPAGYRMAINMKRGAHCWDAALQNYGDPDELFARDPTIFALINGERRLHDDQLKLGVPVTADDEEGTSAGLKYSRIMLCTAHPAFVEMNVRYFSKLFDAGYEWTEYCQSDGHRTCECEKCKAMDSVPDSWWKDCDRKYNWDWEVNYDLNVPVAERLWDPMYEFTRRLYEKYPDRKLMLYIYNPTYPPSRKHPQFPPNAGVALCRHTPKYFEAFKSFKRKSCYTYWFGVYHVQGLTPKTQPHRIAADLRRFALHGAIGVHSCCGGEVWGLEGPTYYAYGRLGWDVHRDVDRVLDEYYRGVYGAGARAMKGFFDLLEERIVVGNKVQTREEQRVNQEMRQPALYFPAAYPWDVVKRLEDLLGKAKSLAKGDAAATNWLGFTELQFRHLKILAAGYNLYREQQANPAPERAGKLAAVVQEREAFLRELDGLKRKPDYLRDWFPGWELYMAKAAAGGEMFGRADDQPPFGAS